MDRKRGLEREFKRKIIIASLFLTAIILNFVNFFVLPGIIAPTGFAGTSTLSSVLFQVLANQPTINITHPLNTTYNFSIGTTNFPLDLNVTSDTSIVFWNYSLYDLKHNLWVYQDVAFLPNTTLNAVRWGNRLEVSGFTSSSEHLRDNVDFFIFVPNSAPVIVRPIQDPIYICENSSVFYEFTAIDVDEDPLSESLSNASGYFFIFSLGSNVWGNETNFVISSSNLPKDAAGGLNNGAFTHLTYASVNDQFNETCCSDTAIVNITVIERNNPPSIDTLLNVTTIWNRGIGSTFFLDVDASDLEFDSYSYGILNFSVNITNASGVVNLFNINSSTGIINFTANSSSSIGNYNVNVCVQDTGLSFTDPNINFVCGQDGSSINTCKPFLLTITDLNRPPTISAYFPTNLSFSAPGTSTLYFNVTKFDPDGTIPDTHWYVDNVLREIDQFNVTDEFTFSFGCGVGGLRKVKAFVTDGLLNDSVEWNISISVVSCPPGQPPSGGGGGGGGGYVCTPKWGCNPWNVCQNAEASLAQGLLTGFNYRIIQNECEALGLTEERCGVQIRSCIDLNRCSFPAGKPPEVQSCLYIENPSCSDGFKNCHDGECEVLVDCGGPCEVCPSCSDNLRNQGEEGVDCGGPCPWRCIPEVPLLKRAGVIYGFLILLLLVIIFLIYKLYRVLQYKKKIERVKKERERI